MGLYSATKSYSRSRVIPNSLRDLDLWVFTLLLNHTQGPESSLFFCGLCVSLSGCTSECIFPWCSNLLSSFSFVLLVYGMMCTVHVAVCGSQRVVDA